jgi:hypothetical protein
MQATHLDDTRERPRDPRAALARRVAEAVPGAVDSGIVDKPKPLLIVVGESVSEGVPHTVVTLCITHSNSRPRTSAGSVDLD